MHIFLCVLPYIWVFTYSSHIKYVTYKVLFSSSYVGNLLLYVEMSSHYFHIKALLNGIDLDDQRGKIIIRLVKILTIPQKGVAHESILI